jgi:glycerol-3-phosphate acyltransferase PlsX
VEGDAIGQGLVDVVVTEGFTGNVALKAAEGTARQIAGYLRGAMSQSVWSKLGYLLARGAFRSVAAKMDPSKANGGVFLGLNGIVIKSHGHTDPEGFANAVDIGYDMVRQSLLEKIRRTLMLNQSEAPRLAGGTVS